VAAGGGICPRRAAADHGGWREVNRRASFSSSPRRRSAAMVGARRAEAGRQEVAAPGRPRPPAGMWCVASAARLPSARWLAAVLGCFRRRVVVPLDRRPRLAPGPVVSGRMVAGSGQVRPDLAGCLEDGRSSLGVAGSPSSLSQPSTCSGVPLGLATSMALQWRPWQ
jgi:hypothetical protein